MKLLALAVALTGCAALGPKVPPPPGEQAIAAAGGFAIAAGATLLATLPEGAGSPAVLREVAAGTAAGLLPMAALYLGEEPDSPTTEGGVYMSLGAGLGNAFGASITTLAPWIAVNAMGSSEGGVEHSNRALVGSAVGVLGGLAIAHALCDHLSKWVCIPIGASIVGSLTTLGYQLAGNGPPR